MGAAWWGQPKEGRLERAQRAPLLCVCVLGGEGVHVHVCECAHVCVWGGVTCMCCSWLAAVGGSASQHPVPVD